MADALRPGGVLAIFWNLEDRDGGKYTSVDGVMPYANTDSTSSCLGTAAWVAKVRDFYEKYENDTPQCE
jgi:hypothetical protein